MEAAVCKLIFNVLLSISKHFVCVSSCTQSPVHGLWVFTILRCCPEPAPLPPARHLFEIQTYALPEKLEVLFTHWSQIAKLHCKEERPSIFLRASEKQLAEEGTRNLAFPRMSLWFALSHQKHVFPHSVHACGPSASEYRIIRDKGDKSFRQLKPSMAAKVKGHFLIVSRVYTRLYIFKDRD